MKKILLFRKKIADAISSLFSFDRTDITFDKTDVTFDNN